ncbi:hypothetical protein KQX54_002832 [Cotesia glomerata]|uniref:Uncharacterized protein n=1 Tax=Cotesia glomerata TaxID=32391 RepID=A0AAV7IBA7_COTGL|nr:hypothetical protein KQX54_002832 [Cotesia glomerata]
MPRRGKLRLKAPGLEARSVIRQVGIHIYRVVKSIGVSVTRIHKGALCLSLSPLILTIVVAHLPSGGSQPTDASYFVSQHPSTPTPLLYIKSPFHPFYHPPTQNVSSPCILILPIIPTSSFGQPFASFLRPNLEFLRHFETS